MAGGQLIEQGFQYSPVTGLIYVFNLIVGTGALTLPAAFQNAGWALSSVIIILLAFMSFLTATFVIESMAAANAMIHWKRSKTLKRQDIRPSTSVGEVQVVAASRDISSPMHRSSSRNNVDDLNDNEDQQPLLIAADNEDEQERVPLNIISYYEITDVTEMGRMASLFFSRTGKNLFYICIAIYLYGDLAIYGAAVSKSVRDVACTYRPDNRTVLDEQDRCWDWAEQKRIDVYRIMLAIFVCTLGQFVFCNVTKTKYLQIITTIMRWLAFIIMFVLAFNNITKTPKADRPNPPYSNINGLPNLFGVCVYSFMCHHSLPSLITPISRKKKLVPMMLADYTLILAFYFLLAFTGIFAFKELNDLYTLNFQPSKDDNTIESLLHYFLALFPVFTLSTNFPIIAITLSNNLRSLFLTEGRIYSYWIRNLLFPMLALIPPTCVAMVTNSLEFLVGITGSYAGAGIQYIVPALLVYYARKEASEALGIGVKNHHKSPFESRYWVLFVLVWAATCIIFVTWNHIKTGV